MSEEDYPTLYAWMNEGEPVTNDENQLYWNSQDDARSFMKQYMIDEGLTDISSYKVLQTEITGSMDAEKFMGFTDSVEEELEADGGETQ